ncbi:SRPBCC family protein [Acinetobacter baumannii]|uniref:SRPBCC family protein n=1 Tax=Acinetobacter baumannii TaxID=470 RepID=UPI0020003591|nr:SRPBCC family protein [Acinetobacter baumannii]
MANTVATLEIPASPEQVWQLIGGFDSLPDWLPFVAKSELSEGARVRSLILADGGNVVERLEAFDEQKRTYSLIILRQICVCFGNINQAKSFIKSKLT